MIKKATAICTYPGYFHQHYYLVWCEIHTIAIFTISMFVHGTIKIIILKHSIRSSITFNEWRIVGHFRLAPLFCQHGISILICSPKTWKQLCCNENIIIIIYAQFLSPMYDKQLEALEHFYYFFFSFENFGCLILMACCVIYFYSKKKLSPAVVVTFNNIKNVFICDVHLNIILQYFN